MLRTLNAVVLTALVFVAGIVGLGLAGCSSQSGSDKMKMQGNGMEDGKMMSDGKMMDDGKMTSEGKMSNGKMDKMSDTK